MTHRQQDNFQESILKVNLQKNEINFIFGYFCDIIYSSKRLETT